MTRPSPTQVYLDMCRELRKLATCVRGQHAALMVGTDKHVVSMGYNGSPHGQPHCVDDGCLMDDSHCTRCIHAELNMLLFADPSRSRGSTVYITGRPCFRCATALVQVGVRAIIVDGRNQAYTTDDHLTSAMWTMFERAGVQYEVVQ